MNWPGFWTLWLPLRNLWGTIWRPLIDLALCTQLNAFWEGAQPLNFCETQQHVASWHTEMGPAVPVKMVAWSAVRNPTSAVSRVRMTWVSQTPSNDPELHFRSWNAGSVCIMNMENPCRVMQSWHAPRANSGWILKTYGNASPLSPRRKVQLLVISN